MASRRDGFQGIKFPGFFCPAGTYGMYAEVPQNCFQIKFINIAIYCNTFFDIAIYCNTFFGLQYPALSYFCWGKFRNCVTKMLGMVAIFMI